MQSPLIALTDFQLQMPGMCLPQEQTIERMAFAHAQADEQAQPKPQVNFDMERLQPLVKRYAVKPQQISQRFFEDVELSLMGADILQRAEFFSKRGQQVVSAFYPQNARPPAQLIHVTCTGYVSPSPVQHLVNERGWAGQTGVTHAYHMGCYAALPAIRIAEGFIASKYSKVDILHTEMCALHMDRRDHSPEQIVVQSLFADGHIKYSAVPAQAATSGLKVLRIQETIVPDSELDMSWITAPWGMKMTLSREVPNKIAGCLRPFVMDLCKKADLDFADVAKEALFAIHPGGPKIIDSVQQILELTDLQVKHSRQILFERGNMSSATLPHVWDVMLKSQILLPGQKVLSLAFGPGVTIFGGLFAAI